MSFYSTLLIDGIQGESAIKGHEDEIDVIGLNWGARQESTGHMGAGGGAGKVTVQDLTIIKHIDKSSPNLFLACATGKHIPKATLTLRKSGGEALDYYTIEMENVFVTAFDNNAEPNNSSAEVQEVVSLKFRMVEIKYQPQDDSTGGAKGGSIDARFDIAANA